jgi:hypothetical protein
MGGDPNGGPTSPVYMTKLKRKVAPIGIVIRSLRWSGYSLTPESIKILDDLRWRDPGRAPQKAPKRKLGSTL